MALVIQKFGGTAVGDPERIQAVAEHVSRTIRRGDQVVMVVSAMGKETDDLLRLASEVSSTHPGREMDMLITAGERKATALMCMALHDLDIPADSFTGSQAGFLTDTTHTNAKIIEVRPDRVRDDDSLQFGALRLRRTLRLDHLHQSRDIFGRPTFIASIRVFVFFIALVIVFIRGLRRSR